MNDKYIVKNCPCYNNERFIGGFLDDKATFCTYYGKKCQGCTECVMKQIIEKCKRTLSINKGSENEFTLGKMTFAEFILKDIDIQEVE